MCLAQPSRYMRLSAFATTFHVYVHYVEEDALFLVLFAAWIFWRLSRPIALWICPQSFILEFWL